MQRHLEAPQPSDGQEQGRPQRRAQRNGERGSRPRVLADKGQHVQKTERILFLPACPSPPSPSSRGRAAGRVCAPLTFMPCIAPARGSKSLSCSAAACAAGSTKDVVRRRLSSSSIAAQATGEEERERGGGG